MPITVPLSPAPSRAAPATFSPRMDTVLSELGTFVTEANALETNVNNLEIAAGDHAATATAQAVLADESAATALAAANYKGPWSACVGAANIPYCVSHVGTYWQLSSNLADVTAHEPGVHAEWIPISTPPLSVSVKTSDATLSAEELANFTVITNTAAGAPINLTLQAGAAGFSAEFEVTDAQYLRVTAAGTDKFIYYNTAGAAGGYIRSNVVGTRWKITWSGLNWSIHDLVGSLNYDQ